MARFSLKATYATPKAGRQGRIDVVREAPGISEAMSDVSRMLSKRGCTKIDIQAWPLPALNEKEPK